MVDMLDCRDHLRDPFGELVHVPTRAGTPDDNPGHCFDQRARASSLVSVSACSGRSRLSRLADGHRVAEDLQSCFEGRRSSREMRTTAGLPSLVTTTRRWVRRTSLTTRDSWPLTSFGDIVSPTVDIAYVVAKSGRPSPTGSRSPSNARCVRPSGALGAQTLPGAAASVCTEPSNTLSTIVCATAP